MAKGSFTLGFWSEKDYFLDRMNLRELTAAYFQYYAIAAYIVVSLATGAIVLWALATGAATWWGVLSSIAATIIIYPAVWYVLHRYVLHSKYMWKHPLTAGVWKRIHYDHHCDPNNLKVHYNLGYLYAEDLEKHDKAMYHLEKYLQIDPNSKESETIRSYIATRQAWNAGSSSGKKR